MINGLINSVTHFGSANSLIPNRQNRVSHKLLYNVISTVALPMFRTLAVWARYDVAELQHPASVGKRVLANSVRLRSRHCRSADRLSVAGRSLSQPSHRQYFDLRI